ncbi:MAG TPA: DnaJ domain-containing protein [Anaeromyxobacteraceae bacterium]|nr:DnaJ domain-containing protein [Anaeromyxobacteraceae bacterium]
MAQRRVTPDAAMAAGLTVDGDLASESPLRLLYLAAATQATGRLVLGSQGSQFAVTLKKGGVEHVLPEAADHGFGQFLVRKGKLAAADLAKVDAAKPRVGGDFVGALIALRLISPAEAAALLQEHGGGLVTLALVTEQGRFRWDPGVAPPASAFPLGSTWSFLCAAVRSLDAAASARRLGARMGQRAARVGGRIQIEDLRLTPQEARAAQLFDGGRTPQELAAANPAEAATILRLALLLGETELLSFSAPLPGQAPQPAAPVAAPAPAPPARPASPPAPSGPPATTPAPVAPTAVTPRPPSAAPAITPAPRAPVAVAATKPAMPAARPAPVAAPVAAKPPAPAPAATPAPSSSAPSSSALDPKALQALVAKLAKADHFEVLGVTQAATGAQIKIAYFQLAKVYHPDAVPTDAPAEARKLAADVFAKVSEAWGVLGDDGKRAQYLDGLKTGAGTEVDVMHIFKAEEAFNAGTLLIKARRYQEALPKLEEAIKLNGEEAEFHMWKAWCQFLLSPEKKKVHPASAAAIEAALRKNPHCIAGYLFLGQMAKITGDLNVAEKHLKRGLKEAPGNVELERELKYLRK